jgi:hypothetical protein
MGRSLVDLVAIELTPFTIALLADVIQNMRREVPESQFASAFASDLSEP